MLDLQRMFNKNVMQYVSICQLTYHETRCINVIARSFASLPHIWAERQQPSRNIEGQMPNLRIMVKIGLHISGVQQAAHMQKYLGIKWGQALCHQAVSKLNDIEGRLFNFGEKSPSRSNLQLNLTLQCQIDPAAAPIYIGWQIECK